MDTSNHKKATVLHSGKTSPKMVTEVIEPVEETEINPVEKIEVIDADNTPTSSDTPAVVMNEKTELEEVNESVLQENEKQDVPDHTAAEITDDSSSEVDRKAETELKPEAIVEELFSKNSANGVTDISFEQSRNKQPLFVWALIVVVVALVTGAVLILIANNLPSETADKTLQVTPTPLSMPTPTAIPEVDKSEYSIQVLNGGGLAGAASKIKTILIDAGYTVDDVGNTDDYSYEETEIAVKPNKSQIVEILKEDLKEDYVIGSTSADLSSSVPFDVRIIVGKQ